MKSSVIVVNNEKSVDVLPSLTNNDVLRLSPGHIDVVTSLVQYAMFADDGNI